MVQVPRGQGPRVREVIESHEGKNLVAFAGEGADGAIDVLLTAVSNRRIEGLIAALDDMPEVRITWGAQGVLALHPPAGEASEQVREVQLRSPIEVFLGGLQSVGSWRGFLGYAALAGAVVWMGLKTNTIYLLIAAMLIAPFAGPAMNAALATARGDARLLGRSVLRYFASLVVAIAMAALLSLVLGLDGVTRQMADTASLSAVAVLLPLAAGAAGALNLLQSERSSLVTGAGTGMLVAASLAPPAGLVGMAGVLGRWDLMRSGLFVVVLQIVAINLAGAAIFALFGVRSRGARYDRGRVRWWRLAALASLAVTGALLVVQLRSVPHLQRFTRAQQAVTIAQDVVAGSDVATFLEAEARFASADGDEPPTLLAFVRVQSQRDPQSVKVALHRRLQQKLRARLKVPALVELTVLTPLDP